MAQSAEAYSAEALAETEVLLAEASAEKEASSTVIGIGISRGSGIIVSRGIVRDIGRGRGIGIGIGIGREIFHRHWQCHHRRGLSAEASAAEALAETSAEALAVALAETSSSVIDSGIIGRGIVGRGIVSRGIGRNIGRGDGIGIGRDIFLRH